MIDYVGAVIGIVAICFLSLTKNSQRKEILVLALFCVSNVFFVIYAFLTLQFSILILNLIYLFFSIVGIIKKLKKILV